jgi:hypothetical protein
MLNFVLKLIAGQRSQCSGGVADMHWAGKNDTTAIE